MYNILILGILLAHIASNEQLGSHAIKTLYLLSLLFKRLYFVENSGQDSLYREKEKGKKWWDMKMK